MKKRGNRRKVSRNKIKFCIKCGKFKVISEFVKGKDGVTNICKDCKRKYKRKHYLLQKEKNLKIRFKEGGKKLKGIYPIPKWITDYHKKFILRERTKCFKTCSKCGETKLISKFSIDKRNLDGRTRICKECWNRYYLERYYQNRNKILIQNKKYRDTHQKDRRIYFRNYREEHKEHLEELSRQYYLRNRERIIERVKKYNQEHKEAVAIIRKRYREENRDKIREYERKYRLSKKKS